MLSSSLFKFVSKNYQQLQGIPCEQHKSIKVSVNRFEKEKYIQHYLCSG